MAVIFHRQCGTNRACWPLLVKLSLRTLRQTGAAPDWVYVTRAGSGAFSSTVGLTPSSNVNIVPTPAAGQPFPSNPVIGRYAYIIYDEGALLDANVAGYPAAAAVPTASYTPKSTTAAPNSQVVRGKSYSTYADLTQLPGMTQSIVDGLVNLRDAGGLSYATANGTGTSIPFLGAVFNYARNSNFLQFVSSSGAGSTTDSPFLSRQDLLNYFAKIDPSNASAAKALPYLGTFTRAVSAPTWIPKTPSDSFGPVTTKVSSIDYASLAETNGKPNRDLANVRFKAGGTAVTHYFDDGTSAQYTPNAGDQLLQSRFSLARIGWLSSTAIGGVDQGGANPATGSGPSSTFSSAIQSCFGLMWGTPSGGAANGGNPCWMYVGSNGGGTAIGTIETLDVVASENREPNFFELLKAAILSGSLGMYPGTAGWKNGTDSPYAWRDYYNYALLGGSDGLDAYSLDRNNYTIPAVPAAPAPALISDVQIMRIGANIIDEYDADSYPTAIYFPYPGLNTAPGFDAATASTNPDHMQFGEAGMIFGQENLPCMAGIYSAVGTAKSTDTSDLNGWYQPQIWSPCQMPTSFSTIAPPPSSFQIRAYGQTDIFWSKEYDPTTDTANTSMPNQVTSGTTNISNGTGQLDGQTIQLDFTSTTAPVQALYSAPQPITNAIGGITVTPSDAKHMLADPSMSDYSKNPFVAFWLGDDKNYIVDPDFDKNGNRQGTQIYTESTGNTYCIGWMSGSNFHPYSFMVNPVGWSYGVIGPEKDGSPTEVPAKLTNTGSAYPSWTGGDCHFVVDCRTDRFSVLGDWGGKSFGVTLNQSNPLGETPDTTAWGKPDSSNFTWDPTATAAGYTFEVDWEANNPLEPTPSFNKNTNTSYGPTASYYSDLDGMVRPGDGYYGYIYSGDGEPLYMSPGTPKFASSPAVYPVGDTGGTDLSANVQHSRRPVILNRPFRSVGELGYAYRDEPFKTLDLFSTASADAALLDVFSLTDEARVSNNSIQARVAGQVNLSNAALPVIQAILNGGSKKDFDPSYNFSSDALTIAQKIEAKVNAAGAPSPIINRADLVTQLSKILQSGYKSSVDKYNKAELEAPIRALGDNLNTRTWNLLIDVIAQSGQFSPNATNLDKFIVQGERRYWLHLAIDRYTGRILDQHLEPVYE